jgi:hypothetical protein
MSRSPVRTVPAEPAVDEQQRAPEPVPAGDATTGSRRTVAIVIAFVVALPLAIQAVRLLVDLGGDLWQTGDRALIELSVHDVGVHPVWVGPYSRFHFNHPGPLLFYTLAPVYRLLGGRAVSINVGALLVNVVAAGGILFVAWRHGGRRLLLWSALLVALWMRFLGAPLLQDPWNPYVTILPFGLVVVLAWLVSSGSAAALPFAVFAGSFVVQTHLGFAPATCAVLGVAVVLGAGVLVRRARALPPEARRALARDALRWVLVAAVVGAVAWILPIAEQFRHHPGNMTRIEQFFRDAKPSETLGDAVRITVREIGAVPRALLPLSEHRRMYPDSMGFGVLTLLVFAGAMALAFRKRAWHAVRAGALGVVLLLAAVWSVDRIVGGFEFYLVTWISAASFLVWLAIGTAVLAPSRAAPRRRQTPRARTVTSTAAALVAVAVFAVGSVNVVSAVRVPTPEPNSDIMRDIAQGVLHATEHRRGPVLVLNDPVQWPAASGVIVTLEKHGISARVPPQWGWLFGARLAVHPDRATALVTIVTAAATPPPHPGQVRVADFGGLAAYVAPRVAGSPIPPDPPTPTPR